MKINWKQVVPVFVIGLVLGAAIGSWVHRAASHYFMKNGPHADRMLEKLSRGLNLDTAQKDAVRAVLDSQRTKMEALHQETSSKFNDIRLSFNAEIKKLLRPEQQKIFDAVAARWEARRTPPHLGK